MTESPWPTKLSLKRKILLGAITLFVGILLAFAYLSYIYSWDNRHSHMDGIGEQICSLRFTLWDYYVDHGKPPVSLTEICPSAYSNKIIFGTMQHLSCLLDYRPQDAKSGKTAVYIRCGNPVLVEYWIAPNGMIKAERWYPHSRWRVFIQRHKDYPELEFNNYNENRVPPPDFNKVVGPLVK